MAKRLRRMLRDSDMAARMGGVLATEQRFKANEAAAALSHRLESATRGRFKLGSAFIDYAGASVGAVVAEPGCSSAQALLSKAEATMQAVKRSRKRDASSAPPVGRIAAIAGPSSSDAGWARHLGENPNLGNGLVGPRGRRFSYFAPILKRAGWLHDGICSEALPADLRPHS
jgi:hypothetical protein